MCSHPANNRVTVTTAVMTVLLMLSGLAVSAALLPSKPLPTEPTLKGGLGNEKFNAL